MIFFAGRVFVLHRILPASDSAHCWVAAGCWFGHAASVPAVHTALKLLDDAGIEGELALREHRTGRVEVVQMWGRPESVRREFRARRAQ